MNDATIRSEPAATGGNGASGGNGAGRKLTLSILRYNPQNPFPPCSRRTRARKRTDDAIQARQRFVKVGSFAAVRFLPRWHCGSSRVVINGRPTLAWPHLTKNFGAESRSGLCRSSS